MADGTPSIVLVDDAADIRALIRARLHLSKSFEVVGEGANGVEAIDLARTHQPVLLLLDASMPVMDGLEAIPEILLVSPNTRIVMFSGFDEEGLAERAIELGATAFVRKSLPVADLSARLLEFIDAPPAPREPSRAHPASGDQALLDEHLERFRAAFDQAAIGMGTMTLTGRVVRANAALRSITRSDILGQFYADLADDETRPDLASLIDTVASGAIDVGTTVHRIGATWAMATAAIVRDSAGNPLYLFLQVQDVTEQRTAEEQLRRSEERFRLLVEGVRDYAVMMLDAEGRIVSWNQGAQRITGYGTDEIIGQHFSLFYDEDAKRSGHPERELEIALAEGRYEEEGWRVRKDGTRYWANVIITAVHDETGEHVGYAKITRDTSDRRAAHEALRQSEERFRILVEQTTDYAIFMLDPTGHIQSWNAGAARIKGYAADEIIGQHFSTFYTAEANARRHPEHELTVARAQGSYEEEGWRIRKDGTRFWANVVITAVRDDRGNLAGFAKVTRDMTEQRAARLVLEQANEQLKEAAAERTAFVAVTAHELRGPVALLRGYSELLRDGWRELDDPARDDMMSTLVRTGVRLTRLVEDLLTATRLESGALDVQVVPTRLAPIVVNVVSELAPPDGPDRVEVVSSPDVVVHADPVRLQQMLANLVTNALRYGAPPFVITIEERDGMVELAVVDGGPGVPEHLRDRLFQKFVHGSHVESNGLGLYIVRRLVEAQGGTVEYEPDRGRFVLRLPAA